MPIRLYIGRLSNRVRERDIEDFFRGYGRVREIIMKNGYGFVDLDDDRDADDAVHDLHGKELCGERVILEHARGPGRARFDDYGYRGGYGGPPPRYERDRPTWVDKYGPATRTNYRVDVTNLSSRVSWQDLKDYMRQAGEVSYAEAHKLKKNEGFVEFATRGDMKNAISKLHGTEINGRKIELSEHQYERSRSRSNRRSRHSHSRSHDKSHDRRHRSDSKSDESSRSRSASRKSSASRSPSRNRRGRRESSD